jgi:FkbM family methyltransferase
MSFLNPILSRLNKPEYLLQPKRLVQRLFGKEAPKDGESEPMLTAWGDILSGRGTDAIGRSINQTGIYELLVTEAIWRLTEPEDHCIDAGANIGYFTGLFSRCASDGIVTSFEPHPVTFKLLNENVATFKRSGRRAQMISLQQALGACRSRATLAEPSGFDHNSGIATLTASTNQQPAQQYEIQVIALDEVLSNGESIGVMKMDVEGYEIEVMRGATSVLRERRIRDLVFEDHAPFPSQTCELLRDSGYCIYSIERGCLGPLIAEPGKWRLLDCTPSWEPRNYVATINSRRCEARFSPRGWRSLQCG